METQARACWISTVDCLLATGDEAVFASLRRHHAERLVSAVDAGQEAAWRSSLAALRRALPALVARRPEAAAWTLAFEFELPRERGRRPDVVVLAGGAVVVVEFKDVADLLPAHLDQVDAYARDLRHYHAGSHDRPVAPVLVLTRVGSLWDERDGVRVTGPARLAEALDAAAPAGGAPIDPATWLEAPYAPLPTLVAAARTLFEHEPLPAVRRAASAGIPGTIEALLAVADEARAEGGLRLALVTGVPGAGKTLVGLQLVYASRFGADDGAKEAVFLSGNAPLVKVLQHALKSTVFVQDVHGFLRDYGGATSRLPAERVWVYDEAQRAWDADRVRQKRGHGTSEPEDFLRIGDRAGGWAVVVGLIGEGQEIHLGEEAGLGQWNDAVAAVRRPWAVHCPPRLAGLFPAAARVVPDGRLDLTASLRSHLAEDVQRWVGLLLDGEPDAARAVAGRMRAQGFDAYLTRDLEAAKAYARERYAGQLDKRYGLLASSKAKNLPAWGVQNAYNVTKNLREGPWYNDDPGSPRSCCQLRDVATEFASQGLELDFPIVAWGSDLTWGGDGWASPPAGRSTARDPHRLRLNSYRVLLSRGRDGLCVFVPPEPGMEATSRVLRLAGLEPFG